jgi:hypothetical protein
MQHMNASKTVRLPSLVETISQGFGIVNKRPWVLLIPLLLDLVYWLGPRISPQPLAGRLLSFAKAIDPQSWDAQRQQLADQINTVQSPVDLSPVSFIPNMLPKFLNLLTPLIDTPTPPFTPGTWHIGSFATLLGSIMLINGLSLLATALFLVPMAELIRGRDGARLSLSWLARAFGSFVSILVLIAAIALLVFLPFTLVAALVLQINSVLGQIIFTFGIALIFWLLFTASFSFDAVLISGVGPIRALLTSLLVVQRSFWSALGLFLIGWVILWGMSVVWAPVAASMIGLIVALIGSAYISSGLAAAHLVFYRDRLSRSAQRT